MRQPWTEIVQERDDYIITRYKEGATLQTIADEVGVSVTMVQRVANKKDWTYQPVAEPYAKARAKHAAIRSAREQGMTVPQIAASTGYTPIQVRGVLSYLKLKAAVSPTGFQLRYVDEHHKRQMAQRLCEMIEMREAGKTLQEIGDAYGLTREMVRVYVGHIEVDPEERICIVCDQPFGVNKKTSILTCCGSTCLSRLRRYGLKRAREFTEEYRDQKKHSANGEKKCHGQCKQWLPLSEFTPSLPRLCKLCAREDQRRRRGSVTEYNSDRRQASAAAQQRRREKERQEAST